MSPPTLSDQETAEFRRRSIWLQRALLALTLVVLAEGGFEFWVGGGFEPLYGLDGIRGQAAWEPHRAWIDEARGWLWPALLIAALHAVLRFLMWIRGAARLRPSIAIGQTQLTAALATMACFNPVAFFWAPAAIIAAVDRRAAETRGARRPGIVGIVLWQICVFGVVIAGATLLIRPDAVLFELLTERGSVATILRAPLRLALSLLAVGMCVSLVPAVRRIARNVG